MNVTILEQDILVTIIDDDTILATIEQNNFIGQSAIQFDDEGLPLGTVGTVTEVDFTGSGVTGSRSGSKVTYNITGGGGGGSGDVVGPGSSVADEVALFSGTTGKLLKSGGGVKDGTGGVAGLTLFKINFKNALNTFTSFFTNSNTAARTYTFQDRDGTIAYTFIEKARGSTRDRYIIAGATAGAVASAALVANVLRAHPLIVRFPMVLDRITAEIVTGTTGNWRVGIYADDGSGYPGALVVDSGQFAVSAPAVFTATINVTLLPGLYWLAYLTDTANTARVIQFGFLDPVLCFPSTLGAAIGSCWTAAKTYGALPDPYTAGGVVQGSTSPPVIALRIV